MSRVDKAAALEKALGLKAEGNTLFKGGDLKGAMKQYHYALLQVKSAKSSAQLGGMLGMGEAAAADSPEEIVKRDIEKLGRDLRNNIAAIHLKEERFDRVVFYTSEVLSEDETNHKALLRRAKAYLKLKDLIKAERDIELGLKGAPADADLERMKATVNKANRVYEDRQKVQLKGMFDRM